MNNPSNSFFVFAVELMRTRGFAACRETKYRTVINRAYYAVFLDARDLVGLDKEKHNAHSKVRHECMKIDHLGPRLASLYGKLLKLRAKADYRPDLSISRNDAKESIKLSKAARSLIAEARLAKIREAKAGH